MMLGRTLYHLIRADVLERTRRYSFLVTVVATVYLGYLVSEGTVGVHLGGYRGLRNSAWVGMMMALCGVTFVSLAGFFVVKSAVERDRQTGVGQILAGTPLGKTLYLAGKTLSNFVVLGVIMVVLAIAAVVLLLVRREEGGFDLGALLGPFVFLGLPAMLFVAALAVFFESVPWLRHGFGNIVYFFAWTALVVVPMQTGLLSADVLGLKMPMDQIQSDVRMAVADYNGTFSIGTAGGGESKEVPVRWAGMGWSPERIGYRLLPVGYTFVLVLLAALCFDRFDATARAPAKSALRRKLTDRLGGGVLAKAPELMMRPLAALLGRTVFGRMLSAELRLMLQGLPWWWHLVALGLWIGSLVPEPAFARAYLLPCLWVWPVFLWSAMGTRESQFRTDQVLFSSPAAGPAVAGALGGRIPCHHWAGVGRVAAPARGGRGSCHVRSGRRGVVHPLMGTRLRRLVRRRQDVRGSLHHGVVSRADQSSALAGFHGDHRHGNCCEIPGGAAVDRGVAFLRRAARAPPPACRRLNQDHAIAR